jgi:hypothetical protein
MQPGAHGQKKLLPSVMSDNDSQKGNGVQGDHCDILFDKEKSHYRTNNINIMLDAALKT